MRGHVHHVTRGGHQREQAVSCGFGLLSLIGFHQVNIKMQCARMIGIARDDSFGEGHNLRGPFVRHAIAGPVTPRPQIHHRFDVEHGDIIVVGKFQMHLAHRIRICAIASFAIFSVAGVALSQSVD